MSRDYEPIQSGQGRSTAPRTMAILLAVAFIGGAIASGWLITRLDLFTAETTSTDAPVADQTPEPVAALEQRIRPDGTVRPAATPPAAPVAIEPDAARALATRVADLEDRLSRINVQAQAASGNAARAEGLLIAFAARRALDRGSELGYLEGQLQLRFGQAQPNAVRTIINAGRKPVTIDQLRTLLEDIGPKLTLAPTSEEGFWSSLSREMSELFVLRRAGSPSPAPEQRLRRAQRFLEAGRVEAAMGEVRRLPGQDRAKPWLDLAERYIAARQALDIIETAAILEPRALRDVEGRPIEQPSPLAPGGAIDAGSFLPIWPGN